MTDSRFTRALALIDAAHADDPRTAYDGDTPRPYELLYAERMSDWLGRVAPEASVPLKLAIRAQHLRRWESPRDSYPMDRAGYHAWRTDLQKRQAELAQELVIQAGFEEDIGQRVAALVRKEKLKQDAETQALEDTTCLVFLAYYFDDFAQAHEESKLLDIITRTWRKMSAQGQSLSATAPLSDNTKRLVEKALAG